MVLIRNIIEKEAFYLHYHDGVRVRDFAQNMDIYPIPTQHSSPGTVSFNPYNGKMTYIEY